MLSSCNLTFRVHIRSEINSFTSYKKVRYLFHKKNTSWYPIVATKFSLVFTALSMFNSIVAFPNYHLCDSTISTENDEILRVER